MALPAFHRAIAYKAFVLTYFSSVFLERGHKIAATRKRYSSCEYGTPGIPLQRGRVKKTRSSKFKNVVGERVRLARAAMKPPVSQEDLSGEAGPPGCANHPDEHFENRKPLALCDGLRSPGVSEGLAGERCLALRGGLNRRMAGDQGKALRHRSEYQGEDEKGAGSFNVPAVLLPSLQS